MDRDSKLRKLNSFRRALPHVTASALGAVLTVIASQGLPELHDRNSLREARDLQATASTPYGPILQTVTVTAKDGSIKHLPIANPFAMLWEAVSQEDSKFAPLFKQRLQEKPPSPQQPWNLVLYSDEVTPGNPLSTNNRRKFQALYWTFLELGMNALSREESWFTIMMEYSPVVNQLQAGLSQAFAAVIKTFFDPGGHDMQSSGMNVPFASGDVRLFAKLGIVIQDGGAHKTVWGGRGDGASKFCLLCKNLFTRESRICDQDGASLLVCDAITLDPLVPSTDADLRRNARFLERQATLLSKEDFAELQQSMGMTYQPKSILLDRTLDRVLKPTEVYMHDWMHALYVDGVVNSCIYLLFESFIWEGMSNIYQTFSDYVANWKFPGRIHGDNLADIFSSSRKDKHRGAGHIKCQASDLLSLTPVLALFIQKVLLRTGVCTKECIAILALVDIVDIILSISRNDVKPEQLLSRVYKFLAEFNEAWGPDYTIPKFHWLLHLAECLLRLGSLLNCFVLERKHRIGKRYATDLANISQEPSKSLLSEVVAHHLGMLRQPDALNFEVGLIGGRKASAKLRKVILAALEFHGDNRDLLIEIARQSRFNKFGTCFVGDVVLLKADGDSFQAGQIKLHCTIQGEHISIVTIWELKTHEADRSYAVWRPSTVPTAIFTSDILDVVTYTEMADGSVGTLLPVDLR
jgi:hypothetical protein